MKHAPSSSSSTVTSKSSGSRGRYKTSNRRDANKQRDGLKLLRHLEKRKSWRIQKYGLTPQAELSRTTRELFVKWIVPLVGVKPLKKKDLPKPVIHKRWGRPQV